MLDFITWTASPDIYSGFVTVRWYGLMFAIGFWFGYEVVWREFRHEGALPRRAFLFIEKGKLRYNQATKGHQQC